jgi:uncharacterized phosphosugar-binding protein
MPYLDALAAVLARARAANVESLVVAAGLVAETVARDGIVYVFGSGHSQLAALELSRRAGGLAPVQVILDPTWGAAERLEGYGETLMADISFGASDCLIVVSHSGATATPVEIASRGRASRIPVIAVTSLDVSRAARARHSSGLKLFQVATAVLDNGAAGSDAAIRLADLDPGLGPTSTVVAAALLHEVVVSAVAGLVSRGLEPPVLRAHTERGGREHNAALLDRYRGRLQRVP